jgi:integrase
MAYFFKRQKKDGSYIWFFGFKDVDGTPIRISAGTAIKSEARLKAQAVEHRVAKGLPGIPSKDDTKPMGEFIQEWAASLKNRNAVDDRQRINKYLLPAFGDKKIKDVTTDKVILWLDGLRSTGNLSDSSVRHFMHLLSRFYSWAVIRKLAQFNPVKEIPRGARPQETPKRDVEWLEDDNLVRELVTKLPEPFGLMFYIGNRAGLRTGEICGLRISDFDDMHEGTLRVRYSYNSWLKEDLAGTGKVKYAPLPYDAKEVIGPWIEKRKKDEGAKPEDLLFPNPHLKGECYLRKTIGEVWRRETKPHGINFTWYQATRHSFVSRNLSRGASLDEVSAAIGHSTPAVTRRFYDHLVRRTFSPLLREGLGFNADEKGEVVPIPGAEGSRVVQKTKKVKK